MKGNLLFRILKYSSKCEDFFTKEELEISIDSTIEEYYLNEIAKDPDEVDVNTLLFKYRSYENKRGQFVPRKNSEPGPSGMPPGWDEGNYRYIITPNALANYLEMVEIKDFRKSSEQAKKMSLTAIEVALCIGLLQVLLAFLAIVLS